MPFPSEAYPLTRIYLISVLGELDSATDRSWNGFRQMAITVLEADVCGDSRGDSRRMLALGDVFVPGNSRTNPSAVRSVSRLPDGRLRQQAPRKSPL